MLTCPQRRDQCEVLAEYLVSNQPAMILTGAGCSTNSGIPDYRDSDGNWKNAQPIMFADFMANENARKRYWARSMAGWPRFADAMPNSAHIALAQLQNRGLANLLVTQNVDRLHQQAGSDPVIDLHGRLDRVGCMGCKRKNSRHDIQDWLQANNAAVDISIQVAPDGDARIGDINMDEFAVPACDWCQHILKPEVVFFGETVPATKVEKAFVGLSTAKSLLLVGTSVMLFSGYRFCREAIQQGKPVMAINRGRTRVDDALAIKIEADCEDALNQLNAILNI